MFLIFKKMLLFYESEGLDLNPDSSLTRCLTTIKLCHLCWLICNEAASPEELKSPFQLSNLDSHSLRTGKMLKHRISYWDSRRSSLNMELLGVFSTQHYIIEE